VGTVTTMILDQHSFQGIVSNSSLCSVLKFLPWLLIRDGNCLISFFRVFIFFNNYEAKTNWNELQMPVTHTLNTWICFVILVRIILSVFDLVKKWCRKNWNRAKEMKEKGQKTLNGLFHLFQVNTIFWGLFPP
jgi:hypothetical protein